MNCIHLLVKEKIKKKSMKNIPGNTGPNQRQIIRKGYRKKLTNKCKYARQCHNCKFQIVRVVID